MTAFVAAGAGFLLAVLWFDLMFDVQVLGHRGAGELPEEVLASISGYYRRVTTAARPMNLLIAAVMLATLLMAGVEVANGDVARGASWASLVLLGIGIGLALARTVPSAVRLGAGSDPAPVRTRLARSIFRDHLVSLTAVLAVLAIQLAVS